MKSKKKHLKPYRRLARASIARVNAIVKYDLDDPKDLTPFEQALLEVERGIGIKVENHEELIDQTKFPGKPESALNT